MPDYPLQQMVVRGQVRPTRFREKQETSPNYAFDEEMHHGKRDFWIPWQQLNGESTIPQARMDFLGYTEVKTDGSGNKYFARTIPFEHPIFPDDLFAKNIPSIAGFIATQKDGFSVSAYEEAFLQVNFESRNYNILTDNELFAKNGTNYSEATWQRYVVPHLETGGKNLKLPSTMALKWIDDQSPVSNERMVTIAEGELTVVHFQIPLASVPTTAIRACTGKINATSLGVLSAVNCHSYQAEVLFYLNPKISPYYRMSNGALAVNIAHRFKWYPNLSANHFYKWNVAAFIKATRTGLNDSTGFYKTADFNSLFNPEP